MSDIAISVTGLGKRYRLGASRTVGRYKTLRDSLARTFQRSNVPTFQRSVDTLWALKDVSFSIQAGEVVGIIGRNGAGKSTLLKILARITEPTEGSADVYGRVGSLLEVGTGFHPELTGRENVYLNGAILGMRQREIAARFDEIVAFAEVEQFIDTPVKHYSSGMAVRLAFAVAAHLEPEILLVDEVLAVGDAAFQKKCLGKIGDVAHQGRTVLFVSHNMQAIRRLCPRAIWLAQGGMAADGRSDEIVDRYLQSLAQSDTLEDVGREISALPSDPVFQLEDVAVLQDGRPGTDVLNGKPVQIRIDYKVKQAVSGLHVYFLLYDLDGGLIFESLHNGADTEIPAMTPGRYASTATIPPDFLAATGYRLSIYAGIYNVRACLPGPLTLRLNVAATGCVNRAYPGYRTPGKLAPLIPWVTERR